MSIWNGISLLVWNVFSLLIWWKYASLLFQFTFLWLQVRFNIFVYVYYYLYFFFYEFTFHILCPRFHWLTYWSFLLIDKECFKYYGFWSRQLQGHHSHCSLHEWLPLVVCSVQLTQSYSAVLSLLFVMNYVNILSLICLLSFNIACVIFHSSKFIFLVLSISLFLCVVCLLSLV